MIEDLVKKLRAADEETIYRAMGRAFIYWPVNDRTALLEAFNRAGRARGARR